MGDPLRPGTARGRLSAVFRVPTGLLGLLLVAGEGGCALLPGQGPVAAVIAISMDSGRPAIVTPCVSPAVTYVGVSETGSGEPSSYRAWAITSRGSAPNPVLTEFPFFQTPEGWIARHSDLTALRDGVRYDTGVDRSGTGGAGSVRISPRLICELCRPARCGTTTQRCRPPRTTAGGCPAKSSRARRGGRARCGCRDAGIRSPVQALPQLAQRVPGGLAGARRTVTLPSGYIPVIDELVAARQSTRRRPCPCHRASRATTGLRGVRRIGPRGRAGLR